MQVPVGVAAGASSTMTALKAPSLPVHMANIGASNAPSATSAARKPSEPHDGGDNSKATAPSSSANHPGPTQFQALQQQHMSLVTRTRKKEETVERLQRYIEEAQTQLENVIKEDAQVQEAAKVIPSEVALRQKFDQYVLEL